MSDSVSADAEPAAVQPSVAKRAAAEFVGLFLLTSIGLMTVATAITAGAYGLFELSIAFAFAIMVIVLVIGVYSGAHINPAITIALATFGRFPWREVPIYIAAQISGGVVGSFVLYWLYKGPINAFERANNIVRGEPASAITAMIFHCFAPNPAIAGVQKWDPSIISTTTAVAGEAFGTFVLALVIFAVLDPRNGFAPSLKTFGLIIGLVVGFIIMVLAPLTMAGINPARDLGPRIATTILGWGEVSFPGVGPDWWVWTVGPIIGAVAGGGLAILMGRVLRPIPKPIDVAPAPAPAPRTGEPAGVAP